MQLPKYLYRGDDDKKGVRDLRTTLHHRQLSTNLVKGGDGSKIFNEQVWNLVNEHVMSRYQRSDFLSFTADKRAAYRYGMDLLTISNELIEEGCEAFYDNGTEWDFALLTLDMSKLKLISQPSAGIYECTFTPTLLEYVAIGYYRIILIDIETALTSINDDSYKTAIEYSGYDKEWLILPAMPKQFEHGQVQFAGIMDANCITEIEKFTINPEIVAELNVIDYR